MPHENDDPTLPGAAPPGRGVTRRSFMQTLGISAAATSALGGEREATAAVADDTPVLGPGPVPITLRINGKPHTRTVDPATTLLEALRVDLDLTGTKEVCDRGACGACSVLVDGRLTVSCMMLAIDAVGAEITTVEGLARGDTLDPVQESFVRHDALQCGFCTPGLVMASRALLDENPKPTLDQIKKGLSGNLCRCGTYTNVFNAVLEASGQTPIADAEEAMP
ncbi:MAG: (2Fe-2S)-binding protein [Phycisphaerales bacterium]|nr:(2Fe-2S)-binding protein [Phycisphaerae bacterium]NNF44600.1 (2Fe-2S)-binding protein [Phycisphaerales bacterium]NNM27450.1 (2Fe-2S)-binding protein [Phycisphaerales bacterium]